MFTLILKNTKIKKIHVSSTKYFAGEGFPNKGYVNEHGVWTLNALFRSSNPVSVSEFVGSRQISNGKGSVFDENCDPSTGAGYLGRLEYGTIGIKTTDTPTILNAYPDAKFIIITTTVDNSIYPDASAEFEDCYIETRF